MGGMKRAMLSVCALFLALAPFAQAAPAANGAPLDPQNLIADDIQAEALANYARAAAQKPFRGSEIVIVDYRMPTDARRLFILNLATGAVETHYVAHGRGSDPGHTLKAQRFSDVMSTGMSSVGAYRGLERYTSATHGPALRLAGLSTTNASAYERLIVFHTAGYFAPEAGRFGRSCGCFVVTTEDMKRVYDVIADGGFLYAGPARLHDRTASFQRDCNTECGNTCPEPLIADARPAKSPAATRVADVRPTPKRAAPEPPVPQPLAKPALPSAAAVAVAAELDPPLPLAKPDLSRPGGQTLGLVVPDVAPGQIPVPAAKPDGLQQVADLGYIP
jgi:hypothetical protein